MRGDDVATPRVEEEKSPRHKIMVVMTWETGSIQGHCQSVELNGRHGPMTYHSEGDDGDQVLLADEDLGHSDVCGPLPWVLYLPCNGLRPREAAEAGDFKIHLHDLVE